jgi:transposase
VKLHRVQLSPERRAELEKIATGGSGPARQVTHARILLKADEGPRGPAWPDWEIVQALDISHSTVERVRRRFASSGEQAALRARRPTPPPPGKLDGAAEAQVITLACSPAPPGQARWTLRLLARRLVELEVVDSVSYETVRRLLKKTSSSPG